jgi:hypothetical protein
VLLLSRTLPEPPPIRHLRHPAPIDETAQHAQNTPITLVINWAARLSSLKD